MQHPLPDTTAYTAARRRRQRWYRVVTALAAVVVFCTTYALILPAITLEADCGIPAHTHTEDCYTRIDHDTVLVLNCTAEYDLHRHTADCYNDDGDLICGYADVFLHTHTGDCYDDDGALVCPLPEVLPHEHDESCFPQTHTHTEDCYTLERGALICTLEEVQPGAEEIVLPPVDEIILPIEDAQPLSADAPLTDGETDGGEYAPGHIHTDECYEWLPVLTCELEECAEDALEPICGLTQLFPHVHTADCYDENGDLCCGLLEVCEHQHDADCLDEIILPTDEAALTCENEDPDHEHTFLCYGQWELVCPLQEHTHSAECYPEESEEQAQVNAVIAAIDALPESWEMEETLNAYEDAEDWDGYEAYFAEILQQVQEVLDAYQALTQEQQAQVTNADQLMALEWLWGAEAEPLTENFHFDNPTTVTAASTKDFIELNLYDYSGYINDVYKGDNKYPGFQWNGGAYMKGEYNRNKIDYIDFGNSNITDFQYGDTNTGIANGLSSNAQNITSGGTGINAIDNTSYGVTNRPIGMSTDKEVLSRTLGGDGYPALSDGTSLAYLFTEDASTERKKVTKQNTETIDGLFQKNETTGAYYYNCRENHAQYNKDTNTFTLYEQIITPNFIVYPFGNFLPFNDITDSTKATQVSSITNVISYVQKMINDVWDNNSTVYKNSPTRQQLFQMLAKYRNNLNDSGGSNWSAKDAIVDYFTAGDGSGDKPSSDTSPITDTRLQKLYNIDWDEETNFFFGMEMSMNFMQPKGGLTGNDGKQEMVFYFTGDDDVWVYIDGVLFLDLSGIHRHVGGKIDFVKGEVSYYALDTNTGDVSTTPYQTYTFKELLEAAGKSTDGLNTNGTFKDYTTHSFKFYYMERGSGSSVCRLNFNFPLLRKNSISVTKELSADEDVDYLGDPDFQFQVLKENSNELFIKAYTEYQVLDSAGNTIATRYTDTNGIFTLKAGQTAVFSDIKENAGKYFVRELLDATIIEQYGNITVSGSATVKDSYTNVTIGDTNFKGVNSPVQDASDGSTIFRFDNRIDTSKLGTLSIGKELAEYPQKARIATKFDFEVKLDGHPIPEGTKYTVNDAEHTVETEGIITLAAGEVATIPNILAGTVFTVQETAESAQGYVPKYELNGEAWTGEPPVTGIVPLKDTVSLVITNQETGTSVEIPVEKHLNAPDGEQHTYQFQLEQVADSNGATLENGLTKTLEIAITDTATEGIFTIDYPISQLDGLTLPATFYYKITEVPTESELMTIYDKSVYIVEVTVSKDTETGELSASVTQYWKNGELSVDSNTDPPKLTFVNTLGRYELPQTGGIGTMWYTIFGALLMLSAGVGMYRYTKKRRRGESASP